MDEDVQELTHKQKIYMQQVQVQGSKFQVATKTLEKSGGHG